MDLSDVARRFETTCCVDAYSGEFAFNGSLDTFAGNTRDSETAERRTISASPDIIIPIRRTISTLGRCFIIGRGAPDEFNGTTLRTNYIVQEATDLARIQTLDQVCKIQPGFVAYAGRAWIKDVESTGENSTETPTFHLHFSTSEQIFVDQLITFEGWLNLVRSVNFGVGGTIVATVEQLAQPTVENATINIGTRDPISDTVTDISVPVTVIRMRWQSLFSYRNSIAEKFKPGDIQVAISKSVATPKSSNTLLLSDGKWIITSVSSEGDVWLCKANRNG